jgi:DNA-binding transcriptional LysR family regulator
MDDKRPDLNLLLALEALLAERNVTRAARRLNLSQPALSAQLARLRAIFGDQLMIPTSRGVLPTATASELEVPLRQALDQVRALLGRAQRFDPSAAENSFTICSSDYMQVAVLLPFLLHAHAIAPKVRFRLRVDGAPLARAGLESGDVDVAFIRTGQPEIAGLHSAKVLTERYVGIARRGAAARAEMTLDRFLAAHHVLVSPGGDGFSGPTDAALAAIGRERRVAFAVASFVALIEIVAESDLLGIAPERLARRHLDRLDLFAPPIEVPGFDISMVWHERTHDHPAHCWLRDQLARLCEDGRPATAIQG